MVLLRSIFGTEFKGPGSVIFKETKISLQISAGCVSQQGKAGLWQLRVRTAEHRDRGSSGVGTAGHDPGR